MESHNWFRITSFSSHASRSWENIEGKMKNFTSTSPEYGAKPWEQALPVFPLSPSTQWKKCCDHLWKTDEHESLLTNNSLIKTLLNCCQLCDSFTYMPPAIPVPVREEETTVLGLWVKYRWISALSGKLRKPIPQNLVQTSFYRREAHKEILWRRTFSYLPSLPVSFVFVLLAETWHLTMLLCSVCVTSHIKWKTGFQTWDLDTNYKNRIGIC